MKYILMVMVGSANGWALTSHEFGDEASCKLAATITTRQFKAARAANSLRTWCARYGGDSGAKSGGNSGGDWTPQ